jgi:hypothetical protein
VFESRKAPPTSYFASWKKWLPVMKAYGTGSAAYFATPPVYVVFHSHFKFGGRGLMCWGVLIATSCTLTRPRSR